MEPKWLTWIREISGGANNRQIALKIGIAPSTVGRWQNYPPKIDAVADLARAYGAPITDGLLAAGYVKPGELSAPRVERNLGRFSASELLAELAQRVTNNDQYLSEHQPITSPADYGEEPSPDDFDLAAGNVAREHESD